MPLPAEIANPLSPVEFSLAWSWWCRLEQRQREMLVNLWRNTRSMTSAAEPNGPASKLEIIVQMDFASENDPDTAHLHLPPVLVDYLVNHPLEYWDDQRMAICTESEWIRQAIQAGQIPADFQCPRHNGECKVRKLLQLAPGKNLRLSLRCRLLDAAGHAVAVI